MAIELTQDQQKALSSMQSFCSKKSRERFFALSGYAGTGKTTLMKQLVESVDREIALTATTNKAVAVLRGLGVSVPCLTIHKLLGLGLSSDSEKRRARQMGLSCASDFDVVIVDEASMVNKEVFGLIQKESRKCRTKFLFVGDPLQLPPVGEDHSLAFDVPCKAELTEVVRQAADNPIIQLTQQVREAIGGGPMPDLSIFNGMIFHVNHAKFDDWMRQSFASGINNKDPNTLRVLAWRNRTVDRYNATVRSVMFGYDAARFVPGERVIAARPIRVRGDDGYAKTVLSTDSEAIVESVVEVRDDELPSYDVYRLSLLDDDGTRILAKVIHDRSKSKLEKELKNIASEARSNRYLWHTYYGIRDSFDDLRPCHAMTVHRSQGSTYTNVMVDSQDVLANWKRAEALRCLYVAYSRAAERLVVL